MTKYFSLAFLLIVLVSKTYGQQCIEIDHTQHQFWFKLDGEQVSNDGKWFAYERNPYKGDGSLIIQSLNKEVSDTVERAKDARFSAQNDWVAFKIYPAYDSLKKQKLDGVKKDKLAKDSLGGIFDFRSRTIEKIPAVKSFRFPAKEGNMLAWLHEADYAPEQFKETDSTAKKNQRNPERKTILLFWV